MPICSSTRLVITHRRDIILALYLCYAIVGCEKGGKSSTRTTNDELDNRRPTDEGETLPEFDVVKVLADDEAGTVTLGDTSVSVNAGTVEGFEILVTLRRAAAETLSTQDQIVFDGSQEIIRVAVYNNNTGEIIHRDLLKKPLIVEQTRNDVVDSSQLKLAYIAEPEAVSPEDFMWTPKTSPSPPLYS